MINKAKISTTQNYNLKILRIIRCAAWNQKEKEKKNRKKVLENNIGI